MTDRFCQSFGEFWRSFGGAALCDVCDPSVCGVGKVGKVGKVFGIGGIWCIQIGKGRIRVSQRLRRL